MERYILGLHAGHNASACIGDETGILFAIQEERLTGEKNYWGFPQHAIRACMERVGARASDIESIAYGGNQVLSRYHSRDDVLKAYRRQLTLAGKLRQRVAMPLMLALKSNYGQQALRRKLGEVGLTGRPIVHYDHHATHAATAYYGLRSSPGEETLVVTCDGAGDNVCASVRVERERGGELIAETSWDNSLGALYSWVTFALGFMPLEHEYKLMGMAPHASSAAAESMADVFRRYLTVDGKELVFERKTLRRTNDLNERIFADLKGKRFDHICGGLQLFCEETLADWVAAAVDATGIRHVRAAGGVFMNVKANKRIAELPSVDSFEVYPSCGDETLSLGAYYQRAAARYGRERVQPLIDFYLGDEPDTGGIADDLRARGLTVDEPADIAEAVVDELVAGRPVARCAGRMEFGARALCNRSILADPSNQDVVRVINQMVKKRDFWMPFAPVVREENHTNYLVNPKGLRSPYMMMTFDTRENFRDMIAAVHNGDLTSRPQIIPAGQNPGMESVLEGFERRTGRAVVLNTSFNLHGFPIVRTAQDAVSVLVESGLEVLQLGSLLVKKNGA